MVLPALIVKNAQVEIGLEVFGVDHQSPLVKGKDLVQNSLVSLSLHLETLGLTVEGVDVFTV